MKFVSSDPDYDIKFLSNSDDFAIDNQGRVIYVGDSSSRGLRETFLSIDVIVKSGDEIVGSQLNFVVNNIDIDLIDIGKYRSLKSINSDSEKKHGLVLKFLNVF